MANYNITLHPRNSDGTQKNSDNLYPKTTVENIIDFPVGEVDIEFTASSGVLQSITIGDVTYTIPQGGGTYSPGTYITITNGVIDVDITKIATEAELNQAVYDLGQAINQVSSAVSQESQTRQQQYQSLDDGKLDVKPDGTHSLIGLDNKISSEYLPSVIVSLVTNGYLKSASIDENGNLVIVKSDDSTITFAGASGIDVNEVVARLSALPTATADTPDFVEVSGRIYVKSSYNAYTITTIVSNGVSTGDTDIDEDGTATVTIVPNTGYLKPASVTVTGATHTYADGVVTLSNPTGDVSITAVCQPISYSITRNITNGSTTGDTSIVTGGTATVTIVPNTGYDLPESITVVGATYTYANGVVTLSNPTGNVTITGICEESQSGGKDFANDSWTTIFNTVRAGTAEYNIGDIKEDTFGSYTVHWRFTDNQNGRYAYTDGSGSSKAVIELVEITNGTSTWNDSGSGTSYNASTLKTFVDDLVTQLPSELQGLLKAVNVYSGNGTESASSSSNVAASCKLFPACANEMYNVGSSGYGYANDSEGSPQFDWYRIRGVTTSNYSDCIKTPMGGTSSDWYWLRSPYFRDPMVFGRACGVGGDGILYGDFVSDDWRVALCFAI